MKVTASYDPDFSRDDGSGTDDDENNITTDDLNGKLVTTVTVHVPIVQTGLTFQVESAKVVKGEIISRVGRDKTSNPLSFDIRNLGPGTAKVTQPALEDEDANTDS